MNQILKCQTSCFQNRCTNLPSLFQLSLHNWSQRSISNNYSYLIVLLAPRAKFKRRKRTRVPWQNHRSVTLSHNVLSSPPRHEMDQSKSYTYLLHPCLPEEEKWTSPSYIPTFYTPWEESIFNIKEYIVCWFFCCNLQI